MSGGREGRRVLLRTYRCALWLLPRRFRDEYGAEMAFAFEASCRQARQRAGRVGLLAHAIRGFADLAVRLPREWSDRGQAARHPTRLTTTSPGGVFMAFDQLWLDVRIAVRALRRYPAFAAVVIGTLALGIGANAAIFSLVDGVLLRPLPYPGAERIVTVAEVNSSIDIEPRWVSIANYADWKTETSSFEHLALYRGRSMAITGDGEPLYAYGAFITHDFFAALGVPPLLGRPLHQDEVAPNPAPVVLISYGLWTRRYGGDSTLVGRPVNIDGIPHTVIGIMPQGFTAPGDWIGASLPVDLWRPFPLDVAQASRLNRSFHAVGRLRSGTTLEAARTDVELVASRLRDAYPTTNGDWDVRLLTWQDLIVGDARPALHLLVAMVGFILVIACANVANLLLNRMLSRRTDIAVRAALGAGRWRLMRQVMTESMVLAGLGGLVGLALAVGLVQLVVTLDPGTIPLASRVQVNGRISFATVGLSLATGVVFGGLPALHGARTALTDALASGTTRVAGVRHRLRDGLVLSQLTLAFTLLVGAGLVVRSFRQLTTVEPGFAPDGVVAATVALSWDRVDVLTDRARFVRDVLEELRRLPGVASAGMVNSLPLSGSNTWQAIWLAGDPLGDPAEQPVMAFRGVSPEYFATMEIPLIAGRPFDNRDLEHPATALVNQTGARYLWPQQDPVGKRVIISGGEDTLTVVGVVGDVHHFGLGTDPRPELYQPYTEEYLTSKTFVVRTAGPAPGLPDAIRSAVRRVDPDQPIREIRTMQRWIDESVAQPRFNAVMLSVGSGLAMTLAAVGLFAVISYSVTERRREIGVRLALGATNANVTWSIVRQGIALAGLGLLGGAVLALAVTRVLRSFLFGISVHDPLTYAGLIAAFLGVAAVASYVPARRASRMDPVETLRS